MSDPAPGRRRRVVIDGGFGGLAAARGLRRSRVEVTLVDRKNHHLFQPLLPRRRAGPQAERAQRVDGARFGTLQSRVIEGELPARGDARLSLADGRSRRIGP
jgi:NADH dehydrogenase FAD-containing subunit